MIDLTEENTFLSTLQANNCTKDYPITPFPGTGMQHSASLGIRCLGALGCQETVSRIKPGIRSTSPCPDSSHYDFSMHSIGRPGVKTGTNADCPFIPGTTDEPKFPRRWMLFPLSRLPVLHCPCRPHSARVLSATVATTNPWRSTVPDDCQCFHQKLCVRTVCKLQFHKRRRTMVLKRAY